MALLWACLRVGTRHAAGQSTVSTSPGERRMANTIYRSCRRARDKRTNSEASVTARDKNGFRIFRYSRNGFQNFSIGFTGNGIFRKRNRFSEFSIGIDVVLYRLFPLVTDFCLKLPDLCLKIFRNCVSEFFAIVSWIFWNFPACDFLHRLYVS
jgi:hypothetical protein